MAYFNEENTVEQMLINAAAQRGWIYVEPKFVPRLPDEVLVVEWLLEALLRLNPITPEQAEQVIYKLRAAITSGSQPDGLVDANDQFRKLLFEENSYPFGENGDNINIPDTITPIAFSTVVLPFSINSGQSSKCIFLFYHILL